MQLSTLSLLPGSRNIILLMGGLAFLLSWCHVQKKCFQGWLFQGFHQRSTLILFSQFQIFLKITLDHVIYADDLRQYWTLF
jgi:hypothetical protein